MNLDVEEQVTPATASKYGEYVEFARETGFGFGRARPGWKIKFKHGNSVTPSVNQATGDSQHESSD